MFTHSYEYSILKMCFNQRGQVKIMKKMNRKTLDFQSMNPSIPLSNLNVKINMYFNQWIQVYPKQFKIHAQEFEKHEFLIMGQINQPCSKIWKIWFSNYDFIQEGQKTIILIFNKSLKQAKMYFLLYCKIW